jgi:hypothetical protein
MPTWCSSFTIPSAVHSYSVWTWHLCKTRFLTDRVWIGCEVQSTNLYLELFLCLRLLFSHGYFLWCTGTGWYMGVWEGPELGSWWCSK